MSRNSSEYLTEEEAEKLEVTCGFCEKMIRIRSLADHVHREHFQGAIKSEIRKCQ